MRMRVTRLSNTSVRSLRICGSGVTSTRAASTLWPCPCLGQTRSAQALTATDPP